MCHRRWRAGCKKRALSRARQRSGGSPRSVLRCKVGAGARHFPKGRATETSALYWRGDCRNVEPRLLARLLVFIDEVDENGRSRLPVVALENAGQIDHRPDIEIGKILRFCQNLVGAPRSSHRLSGRNNPAGNRPPGRQKHCNRAASNPKNRRCRNNAPSSNRCIRG